MSDDGKLLGEMVLFPFELTASDYLRRLFVCILNGIREPICYIIAKECVPLGLMKSLTSFDSRNPITLLRVLLGAYKVCGSSKEEIERHSFEIQSIFYSYIGNKKSHVHSIQTLLREAIYLSLREYQMEMGGKLPNMSATFEAARNLLDCFSVSFDCSKIPLIHAIELQTQCEKHRRSKEERCIKENLIWPQQSVEDNDNLTDIIDSQFQVAEREQLELEQMKTDFSCKVTKVMNNSIEIFSEVQKLLQSSDVYKYICLGRLNGMKSFIEIKITNSIKQRELIIAKELRELHVAIVNTVEVISKSLAPSASQRIEDIFAGKLERIKHLTSEFQLLEEDCLALENLEFVTELQSCREKAAKLMLEMNVIIAAPTLKLRFTSDSSNLPITSDMLYTTKFRDGISIEILSFKINAMALYKSISKWPHITTMILSSSQLEQMNDDEISNPLSLRLYGVPAYKLLRVGLTPLKLLKVGYSRFEILESIQQSEHMTTDMERGKDHDDLENLLENSFESKKISELSSDTDFGELLYALKDDGYDATHCLSVDFKLKELLKVGFDGYECMKAVIETHKFVPTDVSNHPSTSAAIRHKNISSSQIVEVPQMEVIDSKLLRSLNLCCERYALTMLYEALDGPNWRCKDNWLSKKPVKEWYGVICQDFGTDKDKVIKLSLRGNMMVGRIPDSLRYLDMLQSLDIGCNDITGSAYDILELIPNLKDVWLENNERIIENVDYASKSRLKHFLQSQSHQNVRLDTAYPLKNFKNIT